MGCGLGAVTAAMVVGCGADGRWWLSVLLQLWILVVGGCAIDVVVVVVVDGDNILF